MDTSRKPAARADIITRTDMAEAGLEKLLTGLARKYAISDADMSRLREVLRHVDEEAAFERYEMIQGIGPAYQESLDRALENLYGTKPER